VLSGQNLLPKQATHNTTVTIGGVACTLNRAACTSSRLECITADGRRSISKAQPVGAAWNMALHIAGLGAAKFASGVSFTFVTSPSVTSVSPTSGNAGTVVTLSGSGFSSTGSENAVSFGGVSCTPLDNKGSEDSGATMKCTIGTQPHALGASPVHLEVAGKGKTVPVVSPTPSFKFVPRITAIAPDTASRAGGTTLVLTGVALSGAGTVSIGGAVCAGAQVSADGTTLTCSLPEQVKVDKRLAAAALAKGEMYASGGGAAIGVRIHNAVECIVATKLRQHVARSPSPTWPPRSSPPCYRLLVLRAASSP